MQDGRIVSTIRPGILSDHPHPAGPGNGLSVGQGADTRLHPEKTSWRRPVRRAGGSDADDADMLREELGDVLMQVAFHVVLEEERGRLNFEQVYTGGVRSTVFRHPNIFASSAARNAGINSWDALKNKEKGRRTLADELDTVPATLPALMRAQKLQKRAANHGVGSQTPRRARECPARGQEAAWDARTPENAPQAAGELLFAAVDALRQEGIDAGRRGSAASSAREAKHQSNG